MKIKLQITETIPEEIEEGILYVSFTYWTTAHKCGCGCGQKVVLRLSPKHWAITLNGESVSMYPSVGNWQLPCRSHYWIEDGRILQAGCWSDEEIMRNRAVTKGKRTHFQTQRSRYFEQLEIGGGSEEVEGRVTVSADGDKDDTEVNSTRWWNRARNIIHGAWRRVVDKIVDSRVS